MTNEDILHGLQYVTQMGSHAYGLNTPQSDIDLYGFCIPPIEYIFPSVYGNEIEGFNKLPRFEQLQTKVNIDGLDVDVHCYNISKYFSLTSSGNPNMLDSLFTNDENVLYVSSIGELVRNNRQLFLSRQAITKYWGYIKSQWHKLKTPENRTGKRVELIKAHGFDTKFSYHILRLLIQLRQIKRGTLTLKNEQYIPMLRRIREGAYDVEHISMIIEDEIQSVENEPISTNLPE